MSNFDHIKTSKSIFKNKIQLIFILSLLTSPILVIGQLDWHVEPVIDADKIIFLEKSPNELIGIIKNGKKGVTNTNGKIILPPIYESAFINPFNNTIRVNDKGETFLYNEDGKNLSANFEYLNSYYNTDKILYKTNKLFGLIDLDGRIVVEAKYSKLTQIELGKYQGTLKDNTLDTFFVKESIPNINSSDNNNQKFLKERVVHFGSSKNTSGNSLFTVLTLNGDTIIPLKYFSQKKNMYFEEGLIICSDGNKYGIIDKNGKLIIDFIYQAIHQIRLPFITAQKNNKTGITTINKELILPFDYTSVDFSFNNKYAKVTKGDSTILYDLAQKKRLSIDFEKLLFSHKKPTLIITENNLKGYFSPISGKSRIPFFDRIQNSGDTLCIANRGKEFYLLNTVQATEFPNSFKSIIRKGNYFICINDKESASNKKSSSYFLLDRQFNICQKNDSKIEHLISSIFSIPQKDSIIFKDFKTNISKTVDPYFVRIKGNGVIEVALKGEILINHFLEDKTSYFEFISKEKTNLRYYKSSNYKYGFIFNNKIISPPIYDEILSKNLDATFIIVRKNGKIGILKNNEVPF